jgi:hypothetical protein
VEERSVQEDISLSDVVRHAAEFYRDVFETLGPRWYEVLMRSAQTKQPPGVVLASLVLAALDAEPSAEDQSSSAEMPRLRHPS